MLKDVGCEYVIVGHSERRLLYRESDQLIARKFGAAHAKGLIPILCVGEQLADREAGRMREVVARQLDVVLELCGAGRARAGRRRLRAGVGDRHRSERQPRTGAGGRTPSSAPGSARGMLELPPPPVFFTAAASRRATRPSCSRCPMSTAA